MRPIGITEPDSPTVTTSCAAAQHCGQQPVSPVGAVGQSLSAAELDRHIRDLARLAEKAIAEGAKGDARRFASQMYAAIKSRSIAHQDAMTAEVDRRIDEGVNYFQWQGKLDAELLAKGRRA